MSINAPHDFIRVGEEEEYANTYTSLMLDLSPQGILEETFALEIMTATWRLRRCRLAEEAFGAIEDLDFDPMTDERTENRQKAVDRARAQAHLILRRSLVELRKLEIARNAAAPKEAERTQPQARATPAPRPAAEPFNGLDDLMALADKQLAQRYRDAPKIDFPGLIPHQADPKTPDQWSGSFCNPAPGPG